MNSHMQSNNWVEKFFRFGYISKGVVYALTGILASLAAIGFGRSEVGKSEIFNFIYEQPFGIILISIVAFGLFGYSTLRFYQCFKDTEHQGRNTKGILKRVGYGISGLIYTSFGIYAAKLAITGSKGDGNSRQFMVSKILQFEGGDWLIIIVAVIIIGSGLYQLYKGISGAFMKKIHVLKSDLENIFRKAGRVGYISRGIVLMVVGYLLWHAGVTSNSTEAKGTDGAFTFLENQFGSMMMAIIAIGLIGYGIFMLVKAKHERINLQ